MFRAEVVYSSKIYPGLERFPLVPIIVHDDSEISDTDIVGVGLPCGNCLNQSVVQSGLTRAKVILPV